MIDRDTDMVGLRLVLTSRPGAYRAAVGQGRLWGTAVIDVLPVDVDVDLDVDVDHPPGPPATPTHSVARPRLPRSRRT